MLPLSHSFVGLAMNINIKTKVCSVLDIYIYRFIKENEEGRVKLLITSSWMNRMIEMVLLASFSD